MHWLHPFLNPPSDSTERQCTTYDGDLMPGLISSLAILVKKLTDYVTAANIRIPRQNYTRKHTGLRKMKHSHRLPLSVFRSRQHITRQRQSLLHICSHTHTRLTALCPGLPRRAGTRKVKPIWILLEQEIVSGSGISWACASLHIAPDR